MCVILNLLGPSLQPLRIGFGLLVHDGPVVFQRESKWYALDRRNSKHQSRCSVHIGSTSLAKRRMQLPVATTQMQCNALPLWVACFVLATETHAPDRQAGRQMHEFLCQCVSIHGMDTTGMYVCTSVIGPRQCIAQTQHQESSSLGSRQHSSPIWLHSKR